MNDRLDSLLSRLSGVRREKDFQWMARCPNHEDHTQSLAITVRDDAKIGVHCFAGCDYAAVLAAIDLAPRDLYPPPKRKGGRIIREHAYLDADHVPLYIVRKIVYGDKVKYLTDPAGVERRILYRLPDLLAAPGEAVYAPEGEKDADTLRRFGLLTTYAAHNGWTKTDLSPLRDRDVYLILDNDRAGWSNALRARAAIEAATGQPIAGAFRPPDTYKDITDLVEAEGTYARIIDADLDNDEPPREQWPTAARPERPILDRNGQAYHAMIPTRLLLDRDASPLAFALYAILDDRAGASRQAKCSIEEAAALLHTGKNQVRAAAEELAAITHNNQPILQPADRRQWWIINNPSRKAEPSSSKNPMKNPVNDPERIVQARSADRLGTANRSGAARSGTHVGDRSGANRSGTAVAVGGLR